jgi:Ca-activated chloride channel family protein
MGYQLAASSFDSNATNLVLLLSDGVANTGTTNSAEILALTESRRDQGIYLSAIGVGMDNYNDVLMEQLADRGMGRYLYLSDVSQVAGLLRGGIDRHLQVVARDARVQVDFNPDIVASYRLIGYENRAIADSAFATMNDRGAVLAPDQEVTALYEVKLVEDVTGDLANLTLLYRDAGSGNLVKLEKEVTTAMLSQSWQSAPRNLRLAACTAEFAEVLKNSFWAQQSSLEAVRAELIAIDTQAARELAALVAKAKKAGR